MQLQQTSDNFKEPLVAVSDHIEEYSEYYQPTDFQTIDHQHQQQPYPGQYMNQPPQQQPLQEQYGVPSQNQQVAYNLPQPIGYPQTMVAQYNPQMPPVQQVQMPPQSHVSTFSGHVVDEQGRLIMKAPPNYFGWVFFITGLLLLWFPFIGIPFLIIGLISRNTEFIFDDRKRELSSESCGAIIKFGCLDRQVIVPYSSINDVVTEMDFSMRVNGVPNGKIIIVTSNGNVQFTKGYLNYYKATETARKILNFLNQRRVQY